ncbi:MAG: hypothetical protein HYV68_02990 [Candidatus Taylorbacteria bacterium]|nr:hypothetical protein [Candidatus Taylorbacteria bacterium]
MERELKNALRRKKIQKAILYSLAAAGMMSVAVMVPNALQMLKLFDKRVIKDGRKYNLDRSLDRLLYQGLVRFERNAHGKFLQLTPQGNREVVYIKLNEKLRNDVKKWDGKWRVIIFDIKEVRRSVRDQIRHTLKTLGFIKLQQSVWVYPYDCEDFITLLKLDARVGMQLIYMIVEKIENDKKLRTVFGLK